MNKKQRDFFENVLREYNRPDTYGLTNLTRTSLAKILQEYSEIDAEPDPEPKYKVLKNNIEIDRNLNYEEVKIYLDSLLKNSIQSGRTIVYYSTPCDLRVLDTDGSQIIYKSRASEYLRHG